MKEMENTNKFREVWGWVPEVKDVKQISLDRMNEFREKTVSRPKKECLRYSERGKSPLSEVNMGEKKLLQVLC